MNRREFLVRATIGGVSVPLLVRQIGCDGDDGGPGPGPGGGTEFTSLQANGHNHAITIQDSEVEAGDPQTYTSTSRGHTHTVTITDTDFAQLRRGCRISTLSSQSDGHRHTWEILYADRGSDFDETSLGDETGHTHTVTIQVADINAPPPLRNYNSSQPSSGNPHTHLLTLTESDFRALQSCGIVEVTSGPGDGHTHFFSISRPN